MTDTLPSWAMEKAREVFDDLHKHPNGRAVIARALLAAYQQGKQDGQREMKERAARCAEAEAAPYTKSVIVPHVAKHIAAAIRRLDEVQNDA